MFCISFRLARINAVVLNIATIDHFLQSQVSKNSLKKKVYRNYRFLFPWDFKKCPG